MSFLKRIFAAATPAARPAANSQPASQFSMPAHSQNSQSPAAQQTASRRELLRLVLRDTLNRTGIPAAWVGADLLAATSRGREPGLHVRLLLKHWDPRLMLHGIAFQQAFHKRVLTLDPLAERWLLGISWQYSLPDESQCPPLPHPGVWTSSVPTELPAAGSPAEPAPATDAADLLGGSIVISGPAASPEPFVARPVATNANGARRVAANAAPDSHADSRADAKADLERLFAVRDADMKRHSDAAGGAGQSFAATEPATLSADEVQQSFAKTDVFRRPGYPAAPLKH